MQGFRSFPCLLIRRESRQSCLVQTLPGLWLQQSYTIRRLFPYKCTPFQVHLWFGSFILRKLWRLCQDPVDGIWLPAICSPSFNWFTASTGGPFSIRRDRTSLVRPRFAWDMHALMSLLIHISQDSQCNMRPLFRVYVTHIPSIFCLYRMFPGVSTGSRTRLLSIMCQNIMSYESYYFCA